MAMCLFSHPAYSEPNASAKEEIKKFEAFTGKIIGNKVRLRSAPDLDSSIIIQEMQKNDLLLVVDEHSDFWAVSPPESNKAYVFRSYILDNTVEAERVNVRLTPDTDSPILTQLHSGDKIEGKICEENHKWLEIPMPHKVRFYVAKEYVSKAGDQNYLAKMKERKVEVDNLLNSAYFLTEQECKKPFNAMHPQDAIIQFETIITSYTEFPEHVSQAKDGLALLQDNYLQKKIAYLEEKEQITQEQKEKLLSELPKLNKTSQKEEKSSVYSQMKAQFSTASEKWLQKEKELFESWNSYHSDKTLSDFYQEQEVNAISINGLLEPYSKEVNDKPGDHLLKDPDTHQPVAFVYSTKVDLDKYIGKQVTMVVCPRPNNNFAFPAYYVTEIK